MKLIDGMGLFFLETEDSVCFVSFPNVWKQPRQPESESSELAQPFKEAADEASFLILF